MEQNQITKTTQRNKNTKQSQKQKKKIESEKRKKANKQRNKMNNEIIWSDAITGARSGMPHITTPFLNEYISL